MQKLLSKIRGFWHFSDALCDIDQYEHVERNEGSQKIAYRTLRRVRSRIASLTEFNKESNRVIRAVKYALPCCPDLIEIVLRDRFKAKLS